MYNFKILDSFLLIFYLWTLELTIVALKIRLSVKFPPMGLILRSQFSNLGKNIQNNKKIAEKLAQLIQTRKCKIRMNAQGQT